MHTRGGVASKRLLQKRKTKWKFTCACAVVCRLCECADNARGFRHTTAVARQNQTRKQRTKKKKSLSTVSLKQKILLKMAEKNGQLNKYVILCNAQRAHPHTCIIITACIIHERVRFGAWTWPRERDRKARWKRCITLNIHIWADMGQGEGAKWNNNFADTQKCVVDKAKMYAYFFSQAVTLTVEGNRIMRLQSSELLLNTSGAFYFMSAAEKLVHLRHRHWSHGWCLNRLFARLNSMLVDDIGRRCSLEYCGNRFHSWKMGWSMFFETYLES